MVTCVEFIQECEKNGGWQTVEIESSSEPGKIYEVILPPWERIEEEIVCGCPSYEFRGRCRHQREALNMVCNWSELDGEPQTPDEKREKVCPECGGRTQVVAIGDGA